MIKFDRHTECRECPLWESANNPGLPSRPLQAGQGITKETALLFVGQSPGFHEDQSTRINPRGKLFIGYTGQLIEKMVQASKLDQYCDVYLSNANRCKPPQGGNETQSNIRVCRHHLQKDIELLQKHYQEVVLVALGAKACYSLINISSLNETLKQQGKRSHVFGTPEDGPRVFATYHPAILHPTRQPGKIHAVEAHFHLIRRYVRGEFIPNILEVTPEVGVDVPKEYLDAVSVDIETYGILKGVEQTVFHPVKSKEVDGVPYKDQIVTVSFAWFDKGRVRTALYIWNWKGHRKKIRQWFRKISEGRVDRRPTLIGQNVKFDLLYLKICGDPELSYWIDPRRLQVDDTLINSFLLNEQQPEKGLKELSTLFGIADYSKALVTGKSGNAKSNRDKNLHYYNCLDGAAALVLYDELKKRIADRYGAGSYKLSPTCSWMRNIIIWDTLHLEEHGSALDVDRLEAYHEEESEICKKLLESAEAEHGVKLAGTGSDAPLRQLMLDCVQMAGLMDDPRVEWTGKTGKISIGVENVNLVTPLLPEGIERDTLNKFQSYKEHSKIVNTYTRPLVTDKRKGIVSRCGRVGIAYPSWYPVPLYAGRSGSSNDKAGGQIQGRFSCKKPARHTEQKSIRRCSISRWDGGQLWEYDVSQDHLRMAALLSGDPYLIGAYEKEGESIHLRTAELLFPGQVNSGFKTEHPKEYTLSKNLNFLVLFKGGAVAYQSEAREKVGIELDLDFCFDAIRKWYAKHNIYGQWQEQMIALASRQGYLELPTGWSRSFGKGDYNIAGKQGEVLNFLHQTPCAQNTHSSQYKAEMMFLKYSLRSVICLQIHDALFVDVYPGEEGNVHEIMHDVMLHPPLLPVFERWVGRTIPWQYERHIYED